MNKKSNTEKAPKDEKKKMNGDTVIKLIVVALIALFFIASIVTMLSGKRASSSSAMGAMVGSMPARGGRAGSQEQVNTVTVSAKTLQNETIQSTVKVTGDISSKTEVSVHPDAAGKVTRILKDAGETVFSGEIIAYIDRALPGSSFAESPVTSPVSGTVIEVNVATGDTVNNGTIIATVGSLDDLELTVYIAEKYANYLKPGLSAYVELSAAPDEIFEAEITSVSPVVNKTNRTIEATLEFDEVDERIKPGMFASVNLVVQEETDTFVVSRTAIKPYNDENTVFIIDEDNIARRVPVVTGLSNDSDIQIVSGLDEGMKVITAGSATEGSAVRIASDE